MSMSTSISYGYGITVPAIKDKTIKEFIVNHKETAEKLPGGEEILDYINATDESDLDFMVEFSEYECNGMQGFPGFIADIMSAETGISFEYLPSQDDDEGDEDYIMLVEGMPWNFNEKERNLTKEEFNEIISRYTKELWGDKAPVPDSHRQEYFG